MQNYIYKARDDYGRMVSGIMTAEDETDLANRISLLGCFLVRAKVTDSPSNLSAKMPRLKPKEALNFTIHLATLLNAGVPLVAALRDLAQDAEKESIQKVIDGVRYRVESGVSFKEALSLYPASFSKLYTAVVGAGENTGKLHSCLDDLAGLLDWQMELRAKMKEAATYPIILFCVMLGVVTLLVAKVIPAFKPLFEQAGISLPLPTRIVLGASDFVTRFWYIPLGVSAILIAGYLFYNSTPKGKYRLDSLKLKLPLFGTLARKIALSRFCHTFALGLRSGVNVLTSLDFAGEVIGNARLQRSVAQARDSVNVGEKLAAAFRISGEFPPLVVRMIGVGEQAGALTQTLDKVNQFYDREVPAAIKRMFALFEPAMIIIMGIMVGGIALSIFLPVFQMAQIIGG